MQIIEVLTQFEFFPKMFFFIKGNIELGDWVQITIRNKISFGLVSSKDIILEKHMNFKEAFFLFSFGICYLEFVLSFAKENFCSTSYIIKYVSKVFSNKIKPNAYKNNKEIILTDDQIYCYNSIIQHPISLLWGVTGSGKTEIFFKIIKESMEKKEQVLLILPEIAIIESIQNRFFEKFGFKTEIWHSNIKSKKTFSRIINGSPVVIGSRSSIFLPFQNLKWIIIDEEHDSSYKQNSFPFYHLRNSAILRKETKILLASATPSIETFFQAKNGSYNVTKLTKRYNFSLPKVTILRETKILGEYTLKRIKEEVEKNNQVIIFLNKRGWSSCFCTHCNLVLCCDKCGSILHYHKKQSYLLCHICKRKLSSNNCFKCKSPLQLIGFGVEKVEEIIKKDVTKETLIFSSDFYNSKKKIQEFIESVEKKKVKVIIGTQMITKGHNFAYISLVVIVQWQPIGFDWRANELNIQNVLQVTGRAGRKMENSEVIIQASYKNKMLDYIFNYEEFLELELEKRKSLNLPPFSQIVAFLSNEEKAINDLYSLVGSPFMKPLSCHIWTKKKYYFITQWKNEYTEFLNKKIFVNLDPYNLNF